MTKSSSFQKAPALKVSILIPCYNAERWIGGAIESALSQEDVDSEVIVVDDGSSDGSLEIIRSFGSQIRWETGPNRGGNRARNRLLELARGEWLQYLDADDYLLPRKIAPQLAFAKAHGSADVIYSPVLVETWSSGRSTREALPIPVPHDPWVLLARWYLPQTGGPLWRRTALEYVGGWAAKQPCCQEHELYLRLLMAGKRFVFFDEAGAVYRIWSEDTVCRRDISLVIQERLKIEARCEEFLRARHELTDERMYAITQARFEMARMLWPRYRNAAIQIMSDIRRKSPDFQPSGPAAPSAYRTMMRIFGFDAAETIASWRRSWIQSR